jgi:hypothetical protein
MPRRLLHLFNLLFTILCYLPLISSINIWTKFDYNPDDAGISDTNPNDGHGYKVINSTTGNGPLLSLKAEFGYSVTNIGDLDQDGIQDLAVGAIGETCQSQFNETIERCGAIYILLMKNDATVKRSIRITNRLNGGPRYLQANDNFGSSITSAGDVDEDGILDILVGSPETIQGGSLYVLFMNIDGTVRDYTLIRESNGNGPPVSQFTHMGYALSSLGDLDGDSRPEFAVSSYDSAKFGRVFLFSLALNGSMTYYHELVLMNTSGVVYIPPVGCGFGWSLSPAGDINGDGYTDMAIGAPLFTDPDGVKEGGAIFLIFLNHTTLIDYHLASDSPFLKTGALPLEVRIRSLTPL